MRAVVFGSGGTLGLALGLRLPTQGYELVGAFTHADCSILDEPRVRETLRRLRPDVVFNGAAYTNVDRAEDEPDQSFRVNALGPELLARACHEVEARLVHYSTDFVFDGEQDRPYDEFDPPSPRGVYARSKLA